MVWYLYLQCRGLRTSRFIGFGPGNRQEFYAFRESQKGSEGTCPGNSLSIGAFSIHVRCRGAHVRSLEILLWHTLHLQNKSRPFQAPPFLGWWRDDANDRWTKKEERGRRRSKKEKQGGRVLDKKQEMDKINHDQAYPLLWVYDCPFLFSYNLYIGANQKLQ